MRVLFLTLYPETMPSSRLRVYQYLPYLKESGIDFQVMPAVPEPFFSALYFSKTRWLKALYCGVEWLCAFHRIRACKKFQLVFVQKGLVSTHWHSVFTRLDRQGTPFIYDVDDDVLGQLMVEFKPSFLRQRQDQDQAFKLARAAQVVITGNRYLSEKLIPHNPQTQILPTAVDTDRFCPSALPRQSGGPVVIGWIGMQIGLNYLRKLGPVLARLAQKHALSLKVISRLPSGETEFRLPGVETEFVQWSYETEVSQLQSCDIGIMPVFEDEWGAGKCGLKLLQYMALGLASVASRVGANRDLVCENVEAFLAGSEEEWESKLTRLIESENLRKTMGAAAREKVSKEFSLKVLAPKFLNILNSTQKEGCQAWLPETAKNTAGDLKITYVLPQMDLGGAERHVVRLAEGLRKRGHDARILCVFGEGKLAEMIRQKGIPLTALNQKKWGLGVIGALKKYFDQYPGSIVHTYLFGLHLFAGLPARLSRAPRVFSSRRDVELSQPSKVLWFEKMGNYFCDHVTACSEAVRCWVLGRENLKTEKITTLYNGVDLREFVPGAGREAIRQEFLIPQDAVVIGTVANFSLKKGYAYLLEAAAEVLSQKTNCYFLFVGSGPLETEMKAKAAALPQGERIFFTGARKDTARLLAAMDIFVFTSLWEGLPNVVLEAMAMQLPVISTPAGGVPEVLTDGIEGRLISFRSGASAAQALLDLMLDSDLRVRLGRAARQKIEKDFSLERMIRDYEDFYREALSRKAVCMSREAARENGLNALKQRSAVAEDA